MSPKILKARQKYVESIADGAKEYFAEEMNYVAEQEAYDELCQWVSEHVVKPQLS